MRRKQKKFKIKKETNVCESINHQEEKQESLSNNLTENESKFRLIYNNCMDVVFRTFSIGGKRALLIYIEGLTNIEEVEKSVLSPLAKVQEEENRNIFSIIQERITVPNIKKIGNYGDCIDEISSGNPVLLVDMIEKGIALSLSKWEKRSIEEPTAEVVVRGPREGFVETLQVNTSLIRRKIRSPLLKLEMMEIGRYSKTKIAIMYIEDLIDQSLLEEVRNRLSRIRIDGILESGMIEEFINDHPYSPFPQVLTTERPDVLTASLLEGRLALLIDGTPVTIIVPTTLFSLLQSGEDYYETFPIGSAIRWLRYFFLLISLLLPSLYVAVITYHQEMVPNTLLISMAASREQIPFPALVEALIMEITFEALREAGLRLPKQVGSAVSIVGAIVIGEAAVNAGIVSAPMVIVVAVTGIASFTIPRYPTAIAFRILRFPIILLAGTLGLLGIMLGIILIIVHLSTLRSFGVPYLSPIAPAKFSEMKDVLWRAPWWKLDTRPHLTGEYNKFRQSPRQMPDPNKGGET